MRHDIDGTPSTERIRLFVPTFSIDECVSAIRECLDIGWTGAGYKTEELEHQWCRYTGHANALFVNSATSALHLALEVLGRQGGWDPGDEVISSPLTFVSTNHSILYSGFTPIFADTDEYMCLDPSDVEDKITSRTRAVIFVGLGGNTGQLHQIQGICKRHGLKLILDGAHMAGTKLFGQDPGLLADASCYSFQAVKNLPTADSGMLCFRESEGYEIAKRLSWLGISRGTFERQQGGSYIWEYDVPDVGYKYNGNSIMASIALAGLRTLDEDNARRREIATAYEDALRNVPGLSSVKSAPGCDSSRHLFQILVEDRPNLMRRLTAGGVDYGVHYRVNSSYPMYAHMYGTCPSAEAASERLLSLPMHLRLSDADIDRVIATVSTPHHVH